MFSFSLFILRLNASEGLRAAGNGSFPTAKRLVPEILDSCQVQTIRAFFQKSWRYMDAYWYIYFVLIDPHLQACHRKGLNARQAEYAVKKYRSHRKVGAAIMMNLDILNNPE